MYGLSNIAFYICCQKVSFFASSVNSLKARLLILGAGTIAEENVRKIRKSHNLIFSRLP